MQLRTRIEVEELEEQMLAPHARKSRDAHTTRRHDEEEHNYRTSFQRDRDRIIHSRSFRRLKHKRQVFLTSESDHHRTRLTHTLEVSQLSRTMGRVLALNEDLIEAIALAHDLGHTPFGHLGEVILNDIMTGAKMFVGQGKAINAGGFKHNYQSVRVVDKLETKYAFEGLNLTAPVREGILKHTALKRGQFEYPDFEYQGLCFDWDAALTLEGQVVAICDEIAQRTHDLEDGIRAGLVEIGAVRQLDIVERVEKNFDLADCPDKNSIHYAGLLVRGLINFLVNDVLQVTAQNIGKYQSEVGRLCEFDRELVKFSPKMDTLQKQLNKFIYKEIIHYSRVRWSDELGKELLFRLFEAYFLDYRLLPEYLLQEGLESDVAQMQEATTFFRTVCDYVAGMTDHFAVREARRLAQLGKLKIDDLNIESALGI